MFTKMTDRMQGGLALFGASAIYASFGPLIRVLAEMFGTYAQVAARMGLAFVFLLAIGVFFKRIKALTKSQILLAVLLGLVSTGIVVFFTISIIEIKIATAVFLLYAASMASSLIFGTVFLKESLGFQKIIALVLAFVGLFMFGDMIAALSFGVLAGLAAGVFEGVANVIRKKLKGVDRTTVLLYQLFVSALCPGLLIVLTGEQAIREIGMGPIIVLIVFAILQLFLNHMLLFGFQHFDVNIGTVILALELFFAALLGFFIFGEILTTSEILGGLAIFAASIVSAWEFKKTKVALS